MKKFLLFFFYICAFMFVNAQSLWQIDPQNEFVGTDANWNLLNQNNAQIAAGNITKTNLIKSDGAASTISFTVISGFRTYGGLPSQGSNLGVFSDNIESRGWYYNDGAQINFSGLNVSKYYTLYVLVESAPWEGGMSSFTVGQSTTNTVQTANNVGDRSSYPNWENDPSLNKLLNIKPTSGSFTATLNLSGYGAVAAIVLKEQSAKYVPSNPAAPTNVNADDNVNMFDFKYNPSYTIVSQYDYTLDSGFTWHTLMTKPLQINNVSIKKGFVGVRVKDMTGNGAGLPLWSNTAYTITSPNLTPSIITLKVVLNGAPVWTSKLVPANLKYNKFGRFGITNDGRNGDALTVANYISRKTFTDGSTTNPHHIKWSASLGTQAYWDADSTRDASVTAGVLTWSQINALVSNGWSLLDNGAFNGITAGASALGFNPLMNAAQNRNYTFRQLEALGTPYVLRFGLVPNTDKNYHSAWEQLGYLGGGSTTVNDGYPNTVLASNNHGLVNVTNWKSDRRYKVHLRHFKDLKAGNAASQEFFDAAFNLASRSTSSTNYSVEFGFKNATLDTVQRVIDSAYNHFDDHIWVCGLQEYYEYFETIQQTNISQSIIGDTLFVTLDQTYLNPEQRWRDMSFLLNSNVGIRSVTITGADDYSYNASTGLINVYKKKTSGYSVPDNAYSTGFAFSSKVPFKSSDVFMDNNYDNPPSALVDADTVALYHPRNTGSLIYSPYDLVIDMQDWGTVVDSVKVRVPTSSGYITKVILARNDNEMEDSIGVFMGATQAKWLTFYPDSNNKFVASRVILRSDNREGFGTEVRVYGNYMPYGVEQTFTHRSTPLKYQIGANTHWWYFNNNVSGNDVSTVFAMLDTLKLHSIRNYGDAWDYQNEDGSQWSFNPVQQGWKEDQYARHLKEQMPDLIYWTVMQGQTRSLISTWHTHDSSQMMKVVVDTLKSLGYGYDLYGKVIWSHGSGVMGRAWINPLSGTGTEQNSDSWQIIPAAFPTYYKWGIPNGHGYNVGDTLLFTARHVSQLPTTYAGNLDRTNPASWDSAARMAYVWAARKGTNRNANRFIPTPGNNDSVGLGTADWVEISNEPDKTWVGYDDYLNGSDLGVMWSKVYDNNKVYSIAYGAKNANSNMKVSTSGLAVSTADPMRGADYWSKSGRGNRAKIYVGVQPMTWKAKTFGWVDNGYDIIQLHNYSYTGGAYQYAGNIQSGLPVELGASLTAADQFVLFRNKYAPYASVDVGEWGYDRSQNSTMNAPYIDSHSAEEVRGAWAIRTLLCYNAHGIDYAQWYRLFGEHAGNDTTDGIQFSTMSLAIDSLGDQRYLKLNTTGYYFSQMDELGDYVYDSTLREDSIYCYRFRKGNNYLYAIWGVESSPNISNWKNEKAVFHERKGLYRFGFRKGATVKILKLKEGALRLNSQTTVVPSSGFVIDYGLVPTFFEVTKLNSE